MSFCGGCYTSWERRKIYISSAHIYLRGCATPRKYIGKSSGGTHFNGGKNLPGSEKKSRVQLMGPVQALQEDFGLPFLVQGFGEKKTNTIS